MNLIVFFGFAVAKCCKCVQWWRRKFRSAGASHEKFWNYPF